MPHTRFDIEVEQWLPDRGVEDSRSPPYTWYTSNEFFEREVGIIFQKSWLPVGRADQVENPGDYFTGELLGNPYVIVRGHDGVLYGHHNVCSHKGCVVANLQDETVHNTGDCFECQYHGWQYLSLIHI